ncbi:hypothetical protein PV327_011140 [Microctonus hyperodae]|uniref:Beta-1,4-glucuronyltransferase 1 n=1 Tax=Microctonus hyperodae TaxID=165561 RepID=A0AA39KUH7_MICHY|nr:hypothetical protein PV327_011140 [Microctonus hyperodae]
MINRPRNLSLMSVIALSLSNMLLTFLLLQSKTCRDSNYHVESTKFNDITNYQLSYKTEKRIECSMKQYQHKSDKMILDLDIRLGRSDSRRQFKTFDSILIGSKFSELSQSDTVCLATQASLEKLHSLVQVAHHWTGSISVALYTAGDEEFEALQKYLTYLRECYISIFERINFSLAVPRKKTPTKQAQSYSSIIDYDCSRPEATLNDLLNQLSIEHTSWRARNMYPQNHMRNLARKNCQSDWVFLTDVDVIPSMGLADSLDQFLRETDYCEKCAYVIPTYEMDTRVKFPTNKSELVRLAKKGLARPFHWKVFIHNQYATNFTRNTKLAPNNCRFIQLNCSGCRKDKLIWLNVMLGPVD